MLYFSDDMNNCLYQMLFENMFRYRYDLYIDNTVFYMSITASQILSTQLFVLQLVQANNKEIITGPLWGEQRGSNTASVPMLQHHHEMLQKTSLAISIISIQITPPGTKVGLHISDSVLSTGSILCLIIIWSA